MTPEQTQRLETVAQSWVGTPFRPHSKSKGNGVSCHLLCGAILREAGLLPDLPDLPDAETGWSRFHSRSLIAEWIDGPGVQWFIPVGTAKSEDGLEPGDVLLFRIGQSPHHAALMLSDGRIISAVETLGCRIAPNITLAWRRRLMRAWRPKVP